MMQRDRPCYYKTHRYTARMIFTDFRKRYPNLWERGASYSPHEYRRIMIWIPSKGKLIYDHFYNRIHWVDYWADRVPIKKTKEDIRKDRLDMRDRFVDALELCITDKGMSQSDIANISGVSRRKINEYINKKQIPKVSTMKKICEALGVDI